MKIASRLLLTVILILVFSHEAFSQSKLGFNGVGGQVGFANPDGPLGSAIMIAAVADLGKITSVVNLEGYLGYWKKSGLRDLILGGTAKYYFPNSNEKLSPFAGGGLAFHFLDFSNTSSTEIGIHIVGGTLYTLSPTVDGVGQLSITLGDAEQIALLFGLQFKLTK